MADRQHFFNTYCPKNGRKKKVKKLRREGDQIKFMDLRFERWQVVEFIKARRRYVLAWQLHKDWPACQSKPF